MNVKFEGNTLIIHTGQNEENECPIGTFQGLLLELFWDNVYHTYPQIPVIFKVFDNEVINDVVIEHIYSLAEEAVTKETIEANETDSVFVYYERDYKEYERDIRNWIDK